MPTIITLNSCKCTKCSTILISGVDGPEGEVVCKCGAVTASGGSSAVRRAGDPSHCEELSRWEVTPPPSISTRKANTIRRHIRELAPPHKAKVYEAMMNRYRASELLNKYEMAVFVDRVIDYYDEGWLAEVYDEVLAEGKKLLPPSVEGGPRE